MEPGENVEASSLRPPRTSIRMTAGVLAMGCFGLLIVAGFLTPSAEGLGTHQQLGLPPCSSRVLFGVRCPSCGMTTSWSYFMRGQWVSSAKTNIGGFMLAFLSIYVGAVAAGVCIRGEKPAERHLRWTAIGLVIIGVVTITDWVIRLSSV